MSSLILVTVNYCSTSTSIELEYPIPISSPATMSDLVERSCRGALADDCVVDFTQASVIAPRSAPVARRAYFASTPVR